MNVYGQMTEAEKKAEEMRKKDAEMLARRKKKFDAARFEHIETTNKVHGQPKPQARPPEEPKAPEKEKKRWRIFKKKPPKDSDKTLPNKESSSTTNPAPQTTAKSPPPIAAGSVKPKIHSTALEMAPNWAAVDKQNETPQPKVGLSSDLNYPRPMSAAKTPTHEPPAGSKQTPSGPAPPQYNTVGYGTAGRKAGTGISSTISAFQAGASKPKTGDPRTMKQPRIESSTSESMDVRGNITRTITRKITEPNGKVRTETEVVEVPANR